MCDWYRQYRKRANAWKEFGGTDGFGLDLEDDRPWWQKMWIPYEPEVDEVDLLLDAYYANHPRQARKVGWVALDRRDS